MRRQLVFSFLITFLGLGSIVVAGVAALKPQPTLYNSTPLIGRTNLSGGSGCSCHGAGLTTSITGPAQLYPGQAGTYSVAGTGGTNGARFGVNVAATGGALSVSSASLEVISGEIRHRQSPATLTLVSGGAASYPFTYTMSGASTPGTAYAIAAAAYGGVWAHAMNLPVTAIRPADPSGLAAGTTTSTSIPLSWTSSGPNSRVLGKTGSYPTSPTDGTATVFYDNTGTSTTATSLTASTAYFFKVWSKASFSGTDTYSTNPSQVSATTAAAVATNWYVNFGSGSDTNNGTSSGTPFKTITKGMNVAVSGDTINVLPGNYLPGFC